MSSLHDTRPIRAVVTVAGRVQGVSFRAWTEQQATDLMVYGWVQNLPDGSVRAVLEGNEPAVRQMIEAMHSGPRFAEVTSVEVRFEDFEDEFRDFKIRRGV